jgi:uncharacterized protein
LTLVLDTSGVLAATTADDPRHDAARITVAAEPGPLLLSPFVAAEIDYLLLNSRRGIDAELAFLEELAARRYELTTFSADDVAEAARVIGRYRDLGIGLADASLIVIAERSGTRRILTLDERHFRALRASDGSAFVLLPADA